MSEQLWKYASCGRHGDTGGWDTSCMFCGERFSSLKKFVAENEETIVNDSLLAAHHREHCMAIMACGHSKKYIVYGVPGVITCMACDYEKLVRTEGTPIATVPLTHSELEAYRKAENEYTWENRMKMGQK